MRPDGAHTHGSRGLDWRAVAVVAVVAACMVPAGRHVMFGGLETALWWVACGVTLSVAVLGALVWRSRRHSRADYVRSIHGMAPRDLVIEENERLRREIAHTRATRLELERQRLFYGALPPGWMDAPADYVQQGTITGRFGPVPGCEALPEPR